MKVTLIKPQGYCAGVNNAIKIALKAKEEHPDEDVYVLGMLVHNELVINELKERGITTLDRKDQSDETMLYSLKDGSIVVFSAHGHKKELDKIATEKHFIIYDATCPIVQRNLSIIQNELNSNHQIIYIGHEGHPEAEAALSIDKDVYFYNPKKEFDYSKIKDKHVFVINQTTFNINELKELYIDIIVHKPKARIENEICNATRLRQEAIINLKEDVDMILIIGDNASSNSKRLLEIAKTSHPNIESHLINNLEQLKEMKIKSTYVAIASGASTPMSEIDKIVKYLESL